MDYSQWIAKYLKALNQGLPAPVYKRPEDLPGVNPRPFYEYGFAPERAALVALGINRYSTETKESPTHPRRGKQGM